MSWLSDLFKSEAQKGLTEGGKVAGEALKSQIKNSGIAAGTQATANVAPSTLPQVVAGGPLVNGLQSLIQGGETAGTPGYSVPVAEANKLAGAVGAQGAGNGLGADLGKFMQSVGYGMLDKPLGREASTWDYLGKTIGQIARLNEGSGLGAGYTIPQGETVTTSNAEKAVLPAVSSDLGIVDKKIDWKNKADVDAAFRAMSRKYPTQYGFLRAHFYPQSQTVNMGLDRSAIENAMSQG